MNRLPDVTAHRYDDAYPEFLNWLRPLQLDPASATDDVLDWAAADFLLEKFESGLFQYGQALALLAALRRRNPRLRVPTAGKIVAEWRREHPPQQAVALPREVVYAAFAVLWASRRFAAAGALMVSFCGLLRIGECLGLRLRSVVFDTPSAPQSAVMLLGRTKRGADDKVGPTHPSVVALLHHTVQTARREGAAWDAALFPISYAAFRRALALGVSVLGINTALVKTHSLRRGGATELYRSGIDLGAIVVFGRWAPEHSARVYIRGAEPTLIRARSALSATQWAAVQTLATAAGGLIQEAYRR